MAAPMIASATEGGDIRCPIEMTDPADQDGIGESTKTGVLVHAERELTSDAHLYGASHVEQRG